MKYLLSIVFILSPNISLAATSSGSLQDLINGVGGFINIILIPIVLAIAFLVFVVNVVRFFIIGGSSEEGRGNAKSLAVYSVAAFVFIISFWGIVNLIASGIGLNEGNCIDGKTVQSDYIPNLAPCSSPRPQPRPVVKPSTDLQTDGFGTGVDSQTDTGPIIPGKDSPVATGTGTPPTKFNLDGTPIDQSPTDYISVQKQAADARVASANYFKTSLLTTTGKNAGAVSSAMFADLGATKIQTSISDTDRIVAMLRLEKLGQLPAGTAQAYTIKVNNYYESIGNPSSVDFAKAVIDSTKAVPTPAAVTANINNNKSLITTALNDYNASADMSPTVNVTATINKLFDKNLSIQTREDTMIDLYNSNQIPESQRSLYVDFLADLKTEELLSFKY